MSALFACHGEAGDTASDGSGPFRHQLDALGIKYKSLDADSDGTLCLNVSGTPITDLGPLRELPLTHLCLQGCYGITDFSPLREMHLAWINLCRTKMVDISVLSHMPLSYLDLRGTRTTELLPLAGVQLASLDIRFTGIRDVSTLGLMPLEELSFHPGRVQDGLGILQGMRTLRTINRRPAGDFWRKFSAASSTRSHSPC